MNKSLIANGSALLLVVAGHVLTQPLLFSIGLFALSGSVTNWLAIHMLFEKVPGLYGSGVIPARFEEFKLGIRHLMMKQFFTLENIDKFLSGESGKAAHFDFAPIIAGVDLTPAFNSLVATIKESSFGAMLDMIGGEEALMPLKDSFSEKMKAALIDISSTDEFNQLLVAKVEQPDMIEKMQSKVSDIIDKRLDELTPELVKNIVQDMIKQHLGWLVIWGAVFGGLFGLLFALV